MPFKIIYVCPRCNRKKSFDGTKGAAQTNCRHVQTKIFVGHTIVDTTEVSEVCDVCAAQYVEVMKKVHEKFLETNNKAVSAELGATRLQKIAQNNIEEALLKKVTEAAEEAVAAAPPKPLVVPGSIKIVAIQCLSCGIGIPYVTPENNAAATLHTRVGLRIQGKKKTAPRYYGRTAGKYEGGYVRASRIVHLVGENYQWLSGYQQKILRKRAAEVLKGTGHVTAHCNGCGDCDGIKVYYADAAEASGPEAITQVLEYMASGELTLWK
jgi:hypothetical protein